MPTRHLRIPAIIFILAGHLSCGLNTPAKVEDVYTPRASAEELLEKLEAAYQASSEEMLEEFFVEWNKNVLPNTPEFIAQNATYREIYEIYKACYRPWNLQELGPWQWGGRLNDNSRYAVVQNQVFYYTDGKHEYKARQWIDNFRPPVDIPPEKVLYLTPEYREALTRFMGTKFAPLSEDESQNRYAFLRPFIPILRDHDDGCWILETHPDIAILFQDATLKTAEALYTVGYQSGWATIVKKDGRWVIQEVAKSLETR